MRVKSFLFVALVAGCASDASDPSLSLPAAELEGTTGTIAVRHAWGVQMERYQVVSGEVVIRGDIIVGQAKDLHQRSTAMVGNRWPGNQVRFAFEDDYPAATKTRVRNALATLETETPIDFIEIASPCEPQADDCETDYVLFRIWDNDYGISSLGHRGGQQRIWAPDDFSTRGFHHEMFHALGRYHEQERSDRDTFVTFREECVEDDDDDPATPSGFLGNFDKNASSAINFGPYTFETIMHYNSSSFALEGAARAAAPCSGHWPLENKSGSCPISICTNDDGVGGREVITRPSSYTASDIDVLWGMYGAALAQHEAGDHFGHAIVHGDFDDDGTRDLAIGAPDEDTAGNTVSAAGAVMVFKGTADGFQPWQLITQSSLEALEEAGDNFGWALAVGDFDDNGIDDLAIGTPGESVGGNPAAAAGAVYLMKGSSTGLAFWKSITQADVGASVEGLDRFGYALAAADFSGDGRDDLAIGSPGETHGDGIRAGHVYIMRGTGNSAALAAWSDVGQNTLNTAPNNNGGGIAIPPVPLGTNQSNDWFGSTLAAGTIDDDNIADLVVGAFCDYELATCAGGAYLFRGAAAGMRGWMRIAQSTGGDASDRFAWAVAVGDVDMDGDDDVLIGAPYDDYSGGTNVGRVYVAKAEGHLITGTSVLSQSTTGSDAGDGDLFGSSIAVGSNGAFDIIAIGAPGEIWGANTATAGAVFVFSASDSGNISYQETLRASPGSDELAEDAFGTAVTTFVQGGRDYLFVGNPQEDASAGNVQVFSAPVGADLAQAQVLLQSSKGTRAP